MEDNKAGRRSAAPTPNPSEGGRQQATSRQASPRTTPTPGESLSINVPPLAPISPHYHRHRHQEDDGQGWDSEDDDEEEGDDGQIERDPTREFPGLPPSFAALESQISDNRSRSDSLSSVSGSNFTRRPVPTPSISPATSTPHHGVVGFSLGVGFGGGGDEGGGGGGGFNVADEYGITSDCGMSALSGAASVTTGSNLKRRGGTRGGGAGGGGEGFHGASYSRCLHENLGEYTPLTMLPQEQDDANVMPLLRLYDIFAYFRQFFCPKGAGSVVERLRDAFWKPVAGLLWFLGLIAWQVLLGIAISTVALYLINEKREDGVHMDSVEQQSYAHEYQASHRNFGSILGFVIGFRVNIAYQSYYEGRRVVATLMTSVREIVLEAYTSLPKGTPGPRFADTGEVVPGGPKTIDLEVLAAQERYLRMTAREIRRMCMLLLAFIRQDVREKRFGFLKGTEVEDLPFTEKNFYLDPVRPRLWDLLTEDELLKFAALPPRARPGVVVGEMKVHLEQMCLRLEKGCSVFYRVVTPQVQNLMACHEAMIRLRDTPVPYPFLYVLNISTFVFVYTTPFFYRTDEVGTFLCVFILIIIYYGLLSIALEIENPFRYAHGGFSLPLEKYCHRVHSDCLHYAKAIGNDKKSFIPAYLERKEK